MKSIFKPLFYIVYFLAASMFFLYVLFPGETVRKSLENEARKMFPEAGVTIGKASPSLFPPGVVLENAALSANEKPIPGLDSLVVSPRIFSLFSKNKTVWDFKGDISGGSVGGALTRLEGEAEGLTILEASFSGVGLERLLAPFEFRRIQASGTLGGKVFCRFAERAMAEMDVRWSAAAVKIPGFIPGEETFEFKTAEVSIAVNGPYIRVAECELKGEKANISLSGKIFAGRTMSESRMDIVGYIDPHPAFFGKIAERVPREMLPPKKPGARGFAFKIAGAVDKPSFFWD